jgi:hypothetical protein
MHSVVVVIVIIIIVVVVVVVVSPLTCICNRMLSTGTFLDRLKYSEIKLIYKKGGQNTNHQLQVKFITSCIFKNF